LKVWSGSVTTAELYFEALGFRHVKRENAPPRLSTARNFNRFALLQPS
jgi:N-acetylglutamate synthase-like GNAT family acetyltransferase